MITFNARWLARACGMLASATMASTLHAGDVPMSAVRVASGLSLPLYVTAPPGDEGRLFIVEQHDAGTNGVIRILDLNSLVVNPVPFLTVGPVSTGGEQGLLGLAFHPQYARNGFFYVNFTDPSGTTIVRRYTVSADPDVADAGSGVQILSVPQPFSNHNGGWIAFGPDGFLYVALGDGGSANDPGNRAQDITDQLLGKILRLDVNSDAFPEDDTRFYAIPPSNPFVGITGDDEIWDYGLRNPWRNSFDRGTGDLYIADVGQDFFEEIDFEPLTRFGGVNYGWRCMEGLHCTGLSGCTCNAPELTLPIHEIAHADGHCSVTGGYVYRGCAMPEMHGTYFFADYCSAAIWSFEVVGGVVTNLTDRTLELDPQDADISNITSFGEDASGEIYICDQNGEIFRIVRADAFVDCDGDSVPDSCQPDSDGDGTIDACDDCDNDPDPLCRGCISDLDGDGETSGADITVLLGLWGPCDGCVADVNGDGIVDGADITELLGGWGSCR